jgi:two-component system, chemotaxis family, sensor kinase Cph1
MRYAQTGKALRLPGISSVSFSPPFGQADLTNCERELIHLAGSIQPNGVLLVLGADDLRILQISANAPKWLAIAQELLLNQSVARLGGNCLEVLGTLAKSATLDEPHPFRLMTEAAGSTRHWQAFLHRVASGELVLELEPQHQPGTPSSDRPDLALVRIDAPKLQECLNRGMQSIAASASIGTLSDAVVKNIREITGYDRVMVYKFDPDGHGKIIAEARNPRLESLLGHHYPATDIPQRARELYLRNRVRMLVDVNYQAVPLVPSVNPRHGQPLDMSMCQFRSMSPLHLQYLKNMGVTATVVASLVREGRLWGLIAAHHYSPRNLDFPIRIACDLLSEVISTRIAAIENYAHAQVAILVRRIEQRLVEATSTEGDWRLALFRNPRTLLQPLDATGAALFHEGEILTIGEVPSTPELRAMAKWIDSRISESPFNCSAVGKENPELYSLTPVASGVLAFRLSKSEPDYLMWFRKEQLTTVTWAGDPSKPMVDDNPLELSPRRSFAAWSEIVRGTAVPWSSAELALANAIGTALVDIVLQINAVRLLIADHQTARIKNTIESSREPVVIIDSFDQIMFCNSAFLTLSGRAPGSINSLAQLSELFVGGPSVPELLERLRKSGHPWVGELGLRSSGAREIPVRARAEFVPARDGQLLGAVITLVDLRDIKRAAAARQHLELIIAQSISTGAGRTTEDAIAVPGVDPIAAHGVDTVISAILTNASLAAMDISDAGMGSAVAPLFEELEASTTRAAELYRKVRQFSEDR